MFSYFAIVNKNQASATAAENIKNKILRTFPDFEINFSSKGLLILSNSKNIRDINTYTIGNNRGIILGNLFTRIGPYSGGRASQKQIDLDSDSIIGSNGSHLLKEYWGVYVAFMLSRNGDTCVIRDPSGFMPVYKYDTEDFHLLFSDGGHFRSLNLNNLSIDRKHALPYIIMPLHYRMTGINGIDKVMPGELMSINLDNISRVLLWHPNDIASSPIDLADTEAAKLLKDVIMSTTHAWASNYSNICARCSGGLDSSIILSCLVRSPNFPHITGLHHYSLGYSDSDERDYAHLAAQYCNVNLIEKEDIADEIDISILDDFEYLPEPTSDRCMLGVSVSQKKLADQFGFQVFFGGEGGDGLFVSNPRNISADYIKYKGFDKLFFEMCMRDGELSKRSLASVSIEAIKARFQSEKWQPSDFFHEKHLLFTEEASNEIDFDHILDHVFSRMSNHSAAKRKHVLYSLGAYPYQRPCRRQDQVRQIDPFLSQPVIETVLALPTYQFSHNATDRGLARLAFADICHPMNIKRQSKGGPEAFYKKIYENNIEYLRENLMDGMLVKYGIIDRSSLEHSLSDDSNRALATWGNIIEIIGVEFWARKWFG